MAHQWHRGVLQSSSWHGLEEVGVMAGAEGMIHAGELCGAWPTGVHGEPMLTASGLRAPGVGIVAEYLAHPSACVGVVGDRFQATTPAEWRDLIRAAVAAGAKPTGAFALRGGSRVLATFEVGVANGLRTNLLLVDAFDGSMRLCCGMTSIRVVCANTLSAAFCADGEGMAKLRHTSSLSEKVVALGESISTAIATGDKVRATFNRATERELYRAEAQAAFDALFPLAPEGAPAATKTRAEKVREEAQRAAALPINNVGPTLGTIWNAATYLVDRKVDGSARPTRSGEPLDSLLFGARAARIEQIQTVIEVILANGTVQSMPATRALDVGVDPHLVGRKILEEILVGEEA